MGKVKGMRKRWLIDTISVVCALGTVFALAVTACFASCYYSDLRSELQAHASATDVIFDEDSENPESLIDAARRYTRTFSNHGDLRLRFLDASGQTVLTAGHDDTDMVFSADFTEAIGGSVPVYGTQKDPSSGERIMAVSCPLITDDGITVGVLCYSISTKSVNRHILAVGLASFGVLLLVVAAVFFSGNSFIKTVMVPVKEITEKARRIASGSYGVQIQTQYADEVGELAETINEMSSKISQNEKMQAEFISQLSHELRTPLTAINGWSETLLADENMDPDTRQGMKIISREAKRLTEMVMDLLDFTRMQDGRMTLNVEPTDIRSEFEDTVFMYGSRLAQEGIKLEYLDTDEDIPEIPCDPQRLRQVFLNILDNAAKHGGEGKRIEAGMAYEDGYVLIRIRDYGPGIPEDEIPLVKKKFYKGSSKARGTGIGLAVCDEIVDMHGGELTLENAPGGGTLVTVRLPDSH